MKTSSALCIAAAAMILAGCSNAGAPTAYDISTTTRPAAVPGQAATPSVTKNPQPQSDTGIHVDAAITAQGGTTVRPGGPSMRFSVTLVNDGADISEVGMVVSLGHCSCSPSPGPKMMPAGSMRMLDPQSNTWVAVPYVSEGTGMDYLNRYLVPPFPLTHGQTITYQLEMQVDADDEARIASGESAVNVTLTDPATSRVRPGGHASLPITVEP